MKRILTLFIIACSSIQLLSAQEQKRGVVEFSVNFMRENPGFECELGNQALMGTIVDIISQESYWYKIISPDPYEAWVVKPGIIEMTDEEIESYLRAPKYICTAEYSHVFSSPSEDSQRITDLVQGDILRVTTDNNGKAVSRKGFLGVTLPSGKTGYVSKCDLDDFRKWADSRCASPQNILSTADKFLGIPYQWGGTSIKGVDCSGLVRTAFFLNGVLLPRNASQQARTGDPVDISGIANNDFSALEEGDLLFFGNVKTGRITHVTIYRGDGKIIHSSQYVRINSLRKGDSDYYSGTGNIICARRVCGTENSDKGVSTIAGSPYYFAK